MIKDPTLKLPRKKNVSFTKPITISEPIVQTKVPQIDPNDRGKQKFVFKSKKEVAKEAQQEVNEELAKELQAEQLKANQEVLLGKRSSEISPEERNTWYDKQF
ncbi:unnamed protein product [Lactuca virosa]|uniref:TPX2 C-terminal domain-containing protein n=1 Tax=Lactuca virosa TaxID=75947 RepID=A0AAU9MGD8_9ASTR|nr:unnamed protein product [Lactuca virosa]